MRTAYQGEAELGAPSLLPASPISMTSQPAAPRRPLPADDALSIEGQSLTIDCDKERLKLKRIQAITNKSAAEPGEFPPECGLGDERYQRRQFEPLTYSWRATNLAHLPLYFEESRLERYGHALPPVIQPIASAAHFFVSVPLLPYKMGLEAPNECVYTLGYYRPGSCAPYHLPGVPLSLRGAIYETGLIGGLFLVH